MRAIRKMEPAWEKVNGCKFALVEYQDKKGEFRPCYQLTKTECLYIATKFNDEARAKLVLRWQELELQEQERRAENGQWKIENSSSVRSTFGRLTLQEASQSAERTMDNEMALRLGSERQGLFIMKIIVSGKEKYGLFVHGRKRKG